MAQSGPAGHPEFIEDADRKVVGKEHLILSPSSPAERISAGGKSPRTKFVKGDGGTSHTAKSRVLERSPVGLITVQEEHAVLKEWSSVGKTDKHDKFKSPALFWEIKLKESNVKAVEKVSARPSASQLVEACHILDQYSERVELQGDGVLSTIKEQLFSSLFADYNANNHREQFYPSRKHLLQACVPYYIIAERQHSESVSNKRRLASLESQLAVPSSRSFHSSETQTDQDELDINSGMFALKKKVAEMFDELSRQESERFSDKLEAEEFKNNANIQLESMRDQLNKVTVKEAFIRSQWEMEKASGEALKEQVVRLRAENDRLKENWQLINNEKIAMGANDEKKINGLSETLKKERARFKQERTDWLDSLIFERYDLLNFTEQAGRRRAEAEQEEEEHRDKLHKSTSEIDLMELKKKEELDKAPKTELWKALQDVEKQAQVALEALYNEEKETLKEPDDNTHTDQVRKVLREQETKMEELLVAAPQLVAWKQHTKRDHNSVQKKRGHGARRPSIAGGNSHPHSEYNIHPGLLHPGLLEGHDAGQERRPSPDRRRTDRRSSISHSHSFGNLPDAQPEI